MPLRDELKCTRINGITNRDVSSGPFKVGLSSDVSEGASHTLQGPRVLLVGTCEFQDELDFGASSDTRVISIESYKTIYEHVFHTASLNNCCRFRAICICIR